MTKTTHDNQVVKVEPISFAKYGVGSLVYGYILQVNESQATVSLPGGLSGTLPLSEVSDVVHGMLVSLGTDKVIIFIDLMSMPRR